MNKISYIILDDDKERIKRIKSALSGRNFNCIWSSSSIIRFQTKIQVLKVEPDVFFVGNVKDLDLVFRTIHSSYKNKGIVRVSNKMQDIEMLSSASLEHSNVSFLMFQ
ncbi:hypothetical protein MM236_15260 [Belliella sp. DSM 107340]|uniref:Response regulatory domain-containing protein n=1 Tax=Belliella calami TaxID=2923436 RepID=A0ABS9URY4_9BACT|nr:hypothetical protein [Belliella calami]MCH7399359.1 hypothetical protein [Belliella calami]